MDGSLKPSAAAAGRSSSSSSYSASRNLAPLDADGDAARGKSPPSSAAHLSTAANATAAVHHQLSLKVMRLSNPAFSFGGGLGNTNLDVSIENVNMSGNQLSYLSEKEDRLINTSFGLTDSLILPNSFGNIYLGETFSSYLSINNESASNIQEVGIKAELQTSSQRFTLIDTISIPINKSTSQQSNHKESRTSMQQSSTRISLLPQQSAEYLINHEIKELGIHILVCSVHYNFGTEKKKF